jgi:hypothetical protein
MDHVCLLEMPGLTMTPKRPSSAIRTGNIENNSGNLVVATGNVTIHQANTQTELFTQVYQLIDARKKFSQRKKEDLKAEMAEVEKAIKEPKVDEDFVSRRLRNIGRMAPDIMELALTAILNPAAVPPLIGQKIAAKAREK